MITVSIVTYSRKPLNYKKELKYQILSEAITFLNNEDLVSQILIIDNSKKPYFKCLQAISPKIIYKYMQAKNLGYGKGHNKAKTLLNLDKYHLILNPDIIFYKNNCLEYLYEYMENNLEVALSQPLIYSYPDKKIQKLCKQNPSLIIQLIRLFFKGSLKRNNFFGRLNDKYEMSEIAYKNHIVLSQYLSGCFMFCRVSDLNNINWFDERFFMYLEDADLTRMLSQKRKCVHIPYISIGHLWARDSHKLLKLKLIAIYSFFLYSQKWGLKLF